MDSIQPAKPRVNDSHPGRPRKLYIDCDEVEKHGVVAAFVLALFRFKTRGMHPGEDGLIWYYASQRQLVEWIPRYRQSQILRALCYCIDNGLLQWRWHGGNRHGVACKEYALVGLVNLDRPSNIDSSQNEQNPPPKWIETPSKMDRDSSQNEQVHLMNSSNSLEHKQTLPALPRAEGSNEPAGNGEGVRSRKPDFLRKLNPNLDELRARLGSSGKPGEITAAESR